MTKDERMLTGEKYLRDINDIGDVNEIFVIFILDIPHPRQEVICITKVCDNSLSYEYKHQNREGDKL